MGSPYLLLGGDVVINEGDALVGALPTHTGDPGHRHLAGLDGGFGAVAAQLSLLLPRGRDSGDQQPQSGLSYTPTPHPCCPHLVQRDKLSVQPHQVSSLGHLVQHEGDEGGVALALLSGQRGLSQQDTGLDGVLDCAEGKKRGKKKGKELSGVVVAAPASLSLPRRHFHARHSLTRLYLALRFLRA